MKGRFHERKEVRAVPSDPKAAPGCAYRCGAVLPGISGGVLCVVFGIYKPVMELLGAPLRKFKTHVPMLLR